MTQALLSTSVTPAMPELNYLHFGFRRSPFRGADPGRFFSGASHAQVYNQLLGGLRQQQPVMALMGAAGSGKTLLLNKVRHEAPGHLKVIFCASALLAFESLLDFLQESLGVATAPEASLAERRDALLSALGEIHTAGGRCLLILDDAHALGEGVLGRLLVLLRELHRVGGLQLIVAGEATLAAQLHHEAVLHPLVADALLLTLEPLSEEETATYIRWQLKLAGVDNNTLFPPPTIRRVFRHSLGLPGHIDSLCFQALLTAQQQHQSRISTSMIAAAANDLSASISQNVAASTADESTTGTPKTARRWPTRAAAAGLVLSIGTASAFWAGHYLGFGGTTDNPSQNEAPTVPSEVQQLRVVPSNEPGITQTPVPKPLEPSPQPEKSQSPSWDRGQMADEYLSRGDRLLELGDVAGARQFYQTAADWGNEAARLSVGKTFDPLVLEARGLRGVYADADEAARWYRLARESGEREASTRLRALERANLLSMNGG